MTPQVDIIAKLAADIMRNRSKVIDDFCRTYIAGRADWFKKDPSRIRRLELVITRSNDGLSETYLFRVKGGRVKGDKPARPKT